MKRPESHLESSNSFKGGPIVIFLALLKDKYFEQEKLEHSLSHKCLVGLSHIESGDGGIHTISFTPGPIGISVRVACVCGVNEDITDYDSW